jgi:hypothetical protein
MTKWTRTSRLSIKKNLVSVSLKLLHKNAVDVVVARDLARGIPQEELALPVVETPAINAPNPVSHVPNTMGDMVK